MTKNSNCSCAFLIRRSQAIEKLVPIFHKSRLDAADKISRKQTVENENTRYLAKNKFEPKRNSNFYNLRWHLFSPCVIIPARYDFHPRAPGYEKFSGFTTCSHRMRRNNFKDHLKRDVTELFFTLVLRLTPQNRIKTCLVVSESTISAITIVNYTNFRTSKIRTFIVD